MDGDVNLCTSPARVCGKRKKGQITGSPSSKHVADVGTMLLRNFENTPVQDNISSSKVLVLLRIPSRFSNFS